MKKILNISKWLHKYIGLALILFLMWMSLSGVLMNHPDLISGISVPGWLTPSQYLPDNWSRSGIINAVFSQNKPGAAYLGGKLGVYKSVHGKVQTLPVDKGFPDSPFYRKTNHLFLLETDSTSHLLAATDGGLYICNTEDELWRQVPLSQSNESVKKILQVKTRLLVFTESNAYTSPLNAPHLEFKKMTLTRPKTKRRVSLVKLFFDLHDGKVWGLPGKLLFDLAGIILFYLSFSAFYAWYYPKKIKRYRSKGKGKPAQWQGRLFRFIHKYHLKLGIWTAAVLWVISATGLFMRPPMLAFLMGDIPATYYPGPLSKNLWQDKIHNALYDPMKDKIIVQASDGLWQGAADFSAAFEKINLTAPLFVMGATVFDAYGDKGYLIGSFSGIFLWERATGKAIDMFTGEEAPPMSAVRPAEKMITGYFKTPAGGEFVTAHKQGLMTLDGTENKSFRMPQSVYQNYRMPLWNYLFEIHNGRFFRDWIGEWYILLVPLGALLSIIITLSGVFDWLYSKMKKGKNE
jgi:hypothetical protein